MIDALLFAFRDAIRTLNGFRDAAHCEIMGDPDGRPPARCGDWFAAVHQGSDRQVSTGDHADHYYGVNVTVTMRLGKVPADRVGDQLLAKKFAAQPGPGVSPSFNARCHMIAELLDGDWGVMQDANNNLLALLSPTSSVVYGFCEPARYRGGAAEVQWVGPDWFSADPESADVEAGIKATLRFEDCRRLEAMGSYS